MLVRCDEEIFQSFWASKCLKEMMFICGLIMTFILMTRVRCLDIIGIEKKKLFRSEFQDS